MQAPEFAAMVRAPSGMLRHLVYTCCPRRCQGSACTKLSSWHIRPSLLCARRCQRSSAAIAFTVRHFSPEADYGPSFEEPQQHFTQASPVESQTNMSVAGFSRSIQGPDVHYQFPEAKALDCSRSTVRGTPPTFLIMRIPVPVTDPRAPIPIFIAGCMGLSPCWLNASPCWPSKMNSASTKRRTYCNRAAAMVQKWQPFQVVHVIPANSRCKDCTGSSHFCTRSFAQPCVGSKIRGFICGAHIARARDNVLKQLVFATRI